MSADPDNDLETLRTIIAENEKAMRSARVILQRMKASMSAGTDATILESVRSEAADSETVKESDAKP